MASTFPQQEQATERENTRAKALALANTAVWALIAEAELTPKPALVDGRGNGAHKDLSLDIMRRSAHALKDAFYTMALAADGRTPSRPLREELAAIGRDGEKAMMAATNGSNAHRGAIWAMGLLIGGACCAPFKNAEDIGQQAAAIAGFSDRFYPSAPTNGQSIIARYGVGGARQEARLGFPHVIKVALPALRYARANGAEETFARLDALMSVMAVMEDTCLLHRGGPQALNIAMAGAAQVLTAGGSATPEGFAALEQLHLDLMALNASPGGAADMLAAALFLDRITSDRTSGFMSTDPRLFMETHPWKF